MTTPLLTFFSAIWLISGKYRDWKTTTWELQSLSYWSKIMDCTMQRFFVEPSQFDCHPFLQQDRGAIGGGVFVRGRLSSFASVSDLITQFPSIFLSNMEVAPWCYKVLNWNFHSSRFHLFAKQTSGLQQHQWFELLIAEWKQSRYWQNRLQGGDASMHPEEKEAEEDVKTYSKCSFSIINSTRSFL